MNRFMKGCAITALVLIVVGTVLGYIGGTLKGSEVISHAVDQATNGKVQVNLGGIKGWGIILGEGAQDAVNEWEDSVNYDIEEEMIFDNAFEIFKGDVKKDFVGEEIYDLDVEAGGCSVVVQESTDGDFHVSAENAKKFQSYVSDGKLYVKATTKTVVGGNNICNVVLSVPAGYHFQKVDVEVGAGVMDLGNVSAEEIEMEVGAGQITAESLTADSLIVSVGVGEVIIGKMQVNKLDAEVGVGNLEAAGVVAEKLLAECAMGNIDLEIHGAWEDYDYSVECGMGNVDIGNENYGGIANERTIDNGTGRKMDVECGMGNITIEFTE